MKETVTSRRVEHVVLAGGIVLLIVWGGARFHRAVASRAAISEFRAGQASLGTELYRSVDPAPGPKVDFSLWSKKRVAAYEASLKENKDKALAILRIPKINLQVPVFDDTDELTLNRGLGRIKGTARIGQPGNVGIAGHRDGFFRGLKDITPGDVIELEISGRTESYVVTEIQIVPPEDTQVLDATPTPTLTLVTCFPFYYIGSAPQRYIVTASIQNSGQRE